jgi:hypothetical protein
MAVTNHIISSVYDHSILNSVYYLRNRYLNMMMIDLIDMKLYVQTLVIRFTLLLNIPSLDEELNIRVNLLLL